MNGCNNCAKRRDIKLECPWGGSYQGKGPNGEKIGICNAYRRKTNADRIRAMSDEELAWELMVWRMETYAKSNGIESTYPDTQEKIYNWLLTPAEGEQHGKND